MIPLDKLEKLFCAGTQTKSRAYASDIELINNASSSFKHSLFWLILSHFKIFKRLIITENWSDHTSMWRNSSLTFSLIDKVNRSCESFFPNFFFWLHIAQTTHRTHPIRNFHSMKFHVIFPYKICAAIGTRTSPIWRVVQIARQQTMGQPTNAVLLDLIFCARASNPHSS